MSRWHLAAVLLFVALCGAAAQKEDAPTSIEPSYPKPDMSVKEDPAAYSNTKPLLVDEPDVYAKDEPTYTKPKPMPEEDKPMEEPIYSAGDPKPRVYQPGMMYTMGAPVDEKPLPDKIPSQEPVYASGPEGEQPPAVRSHVIMPNYRKGPEEPVSDGRVYKGGAQPAVTDRASTTGTSNKPTSTSTHKPPAAKAAASKPSTTKPATTKPTTPKPTISKPASTAKPTSNKKPTSTHKPTIKMPTKHTSKPVQCVTKLQAQPIKCDAKHDPKAANAGAKPLCTKTPIATKHPETQACGKPAVQQAAKPVVVTAVRPATTKPTTKPAAKPVAKGSHKTGRKLMMA